MKINYNNTNQTFEFGTKFENFTLDQKAFNEYLSTLKIYELASIVSSNWDKVNYGAKEYLLVMHFLSETTDFYDATSAKEILLYFLNNARSWTGPAAKSVKSELKRRTNIK